MQKNSISNEDKKANVAKMLKKYFRFVMIVKKGEMSMEEKQSRKELVKRYAVFTGFVVKCFQDKLGNAVDRFLEK